LYPATGPRYHFPAYECTDFTHHPLPVSPILGTPGDVLGFLAQCDLRAGRHAPQVSVPNLRPAPPHIESHRARVGRIESQHTGSLAADVTVTQAPTTVTIQLASAESGEWQIQSSGVVVAAPEPVTYSVKEFGTPMRAYALGLGTEAGLPIAIRVPVHDATAATLGATAWASIIAFDSLGSSLVAGDTNSRKDRMTKPHQVWAARHRRSAVVSTSCSSAFANTTTTMPGF